MNYIPSDFYCPITHELMRNPYSSKYGHSYEYDAIVKWIESNNTCPKTRKTLTKNDLVVNISLKNSIDDIRETLSKEQLILHSDAFNSSNKKFIENRQKINVSGAYNPDVNEMLISVNIPDSNERQPTDILLCIDKSGSMGCNATIKTSTGENIRNGISVLSLTICAAKTILNSLNDKDTISIITYDTHVNELCINQSVTPDNIADIESNLDKLQPGGTTNLWGGIKASLDCIKDFSPPEKNKAIFLLTDGLPSEYLIPPRGIEQMIDNYFKQTLFKCPINTYGFGYSLDSVLLQNISEKSNADGFAYIPDSSLLGNIFIHGLSNSLTTVADNCIINLELTEGLIFTDSGQKTKTVNIHSLKYGQNKDLIFSIKAMKQHFTPAKLGNYCLEFKNTNIKGEIEHNESNEYFWEQYYRNLAVNTLKECMKSMNFNEKENVKLLIDTLIKDIQNNILVQNSHFIINILFDLEGQIREAFNMTRIGESEDWYNKWGKHYILSLVDAYNNQICNNFKDKGVSNFGGKLFNSLVDNISDVFDSQPIPTSFSSNSLQYGGPGCTVLQTAFDMSAFRNQSGGCCAKGSRIIMADKTFMNIENLKKGDKIITVSKQNSNFIYSISSVECLVKTKCSNNNQLMVTLPSLIDNNTVSFTPYHPIIDYKSSHTWIFPKEHNTLLKNPSNYNTIYCEEMYTLVIENRQSVLIEDYIFATYGHYLNEKTIFHEYFGTDQVIEDLKKFHTYDSGIVTLKPEMFLRNHNTNLDSKCDVYKITDNYH